MRVILFIIFLIPGSPPLIGEHPMPSFEICQDTIRRLTLPENPPQSYELSFGCKITKE